MLWLSNFMALSSLSHRLSARFMASCTIPIVPYIQELHGVSAPCFYSVYSTGGGVAALQWLLSVPGASKSMKLAHIPYARSAFQDILAQKGAYKPTVSSLCSEEAAVVLAKAAYEQTLQHVLAENPQDIHANIFGVGCTAALVTNTPKQGPHRCHLAVYSPTTAIRTKCITLDKLAHRNRADEDALVSLFVLDMLRQQVGLTALPAEAFGYLAFNPHTEPVTENTLPAANLLEGVLAGHQSHMVLFPSSGPVSSWTCSDQVQLPDSIVFPGSFNPLHEGHIALAKAALAHTGAKRVIFELAAVNADKPSIALDAILQRLEQFRALPFDVAVAVTRLPLFTSKAGLFGGCHFLIGADTLVRLLDTKYYTTSSSETNGLLQLTKAMAAIHSAGCSFIVGGRAKDGAFFTLDDITSSSAVARDMLEVFPGMFQGLREEDFRVDLSSTEIRKRMEQQRLAGSK